MADMRLLVALLLCLHVAVSPAFAGLLHGDCADAKATTSSGCLPDCPDEDGDTPCSDSCQLCLCCPAVAPLPTVPSVARVCAPSSSCSPSHVGAHPHSPAPDIFHPPQILLAPPSSP